MGISAARAPQHFPRVRVDTHCTRREASPKDVDEDTQQALVTEQSASIPWRPWSARKAGRCSAASSRTSTSYNSQRREVSWKFFFSTPLHMHEELTLSLTRRIGERSIVDTSKGKSCVTLSLVSLLCSLLSFHSLLDTWDSFRNLSLPLAIDYIQSPLSQKKGVSKARSVWREERSTTSRKLWRDWSSATKDGSMHWAIGTAL